MNALLFNVAVDNETHAECVCVCRSVDIVLFLLIA